MAAATAPAMAAATTAAGEGALALTVSGSRTLSKPAGTRRQRAPDSLRFLPKTAPDTTSKDTTAVQTAMTSK
jgi:hypothetical protein